MATATTDDTTVEIEVDGKRSGPIPLDEFERRARRQLSFDVGGATPDFATVKLGGDLGTEGSLRKGDSVHVRVTSEDGELVAEGDGYVTAVAFKDKRNKFGDIESTERVHSVTLA